MGDATVRGAGVYGARRENTTNASLSHTVVNFLPIAGSCYDPEDPSTDWVAQNFEHAAGDYPWVTQFSDRAVTELEFRHGFLNDPSPVSA